MSSVSEQDHLNPRDPLYYAPRSLRERSATRGASPETPFSPASFDTQLENAVSDALWHPLDPEVMHEPEARSEGVEDRRGALRRGRRRLRLVALFFVVVVPGSRLGDGEPSASPASCSRSRPRCLHPAEDVAEACDQRIPGHARLDAAERPGASEQDSQLLNSSCSGARSRNRPRHNAPTHNPDGGATMPENRSR